MVFTPSPLLLKLLYNRGSLHNLPDQQGVAFSIKNLLDTVQLTGVEQVSIGGVVVPAAAIQLELAGGAVRLASSLGPEPGQALELAVGQGLTFMLATAPLPE
ncbi:MAG: hydroxymethylglutaryl-CoA reductase, partial [Hymenobacter sp.]